MRNLIVLPAIRKRCFHWCTSAFFISFTEACSCERMKKKNDFIFLCCYHKSRYLWQKDLLVFFCERPTDKKELLPHVYFFPVGTSPIFFNGFTTNSFHFRTLHKRPISTMVFLLTNMLNILSCNGKLNNRWWLLLLLHINAVFLEKFRNVSRKFPEWEKRSHLFQKGPICFKKVPFVSERSHLFQKGPICFRKVPFTSQMSHLFHRCPIYFKATSLPALSLRIASDCWREQASYQQEMSTVQHDIFPFISRAVPFISMQFPKHYHYVLHLTAEVNKHHTSRKCQQSNTIFRVIMMMHASYKKR